MNRLADPRIDEMLAKLQEINAAYYDVEAGIDKYVLADFANQQAFCDAYKELRLCILNLLCASTVDGAIKNTSEAA